MTDDDQRTLGDGGPRQVETSADITERRVTESADKVRLETQVKRGDGTRDEDRIKVKIKSDTPDDAAAKLAATLNALEEHGVASTLRDVRDESEDEDDDR